MDLSTFRQISEFLTNLSAEEEYDSEEGKWTFKSGGSCFLCTDSATKIADKFGGRVLGYYSTRNTSALIGKDLIAGHDFALVEERYIVDYWAFRMKIMNKPIWDLKNPGDYEAIRKYYGDQRSWESVPISQSKSIGLMKW